jgi:hypothetical protein
MFKHLKDEQHYYDLYDRYTVENCLRLEKADTSKKHKLQKAWGKTVIELMLYFEKGERYANREQTVREWIENDRRRDEHFENAIDPENVRCKFCDKEMELIHKSLEIFPDQMSYVYACKECQFLKYIWENGKEKDVIPWKCPNCSRRLKITDKKVGHKLKSTGSCQFCEYKDESVLDLGPKKEPEIDPNELKEFRINKDRFCLSGEKGREYVHQKTNMERLSAVVEKIKKEKTEKKPDQKTLTIVQLRNLLKQAVLKKGYIKFSLGEPKIEKDIIVSFCVQDNKDRDEYKSKTELKHLINGALKDTNWKLMSDGLNYRLGILSGRLRGSDGHQYGIGDVLY